DALFDVVMYLALWFVGPGGRGVGYRTVSGVVLDLHAGLALQARGDTDLAALAASLCRGIAGDLARALPKLRHLGGEGAGAVRPHVVTKEDNVARRGVGHWDRRSDCAVGHHHRGEPRELFRHLLLQLPPVP